MITLEELATDEQIKEEYKKSFLLNLFRKLAIRMNKDNAFKVKIHKLYLESTDKIVSTTVIIQRYFNYRIEKQDAQLLLQWLTAYFNKQNTRKRISVDEKRLLCIKQGWKCALCGEDLGSDLSKIHVDHIVPWILVGDELPNNHQCLCPICNESKSAQTDYIFRRLINIE